MSSALIAAAVALATTLLAAPLRVWADTVLQGRRLKAEYEYEQRRELRTLIGRYHGRLLAACESWSDRLGNLYYRGEEAGWLNTTSGYYARTTCYRFLTVCSLGRAFEREAYFIDSRYAEATDLDFVSFLRSFRWAITDPALFRDLDLDYEESVSRDHFFADQLRWICDAFFPANAEMLTYQEFEAAVDVPESPFKDVVEFFLGLSPREDRFRWDRVVCLHLFVMAFMNTVGYTVQRSADADFEAVASEIQHSDRKSVV